MLRRTLLAAAAALTLVLPAYPQQAPQAFLFESGPVYSMDGAWQGTATIDAAGLVTPTLDTFASDLKKLGLEGTFLCTIPPSTMPNPNNPNGSLTVTASGHGNWVRIGRNKYAFTALRTIFDENGKLFGIARNWGIITPVSNDEYTGTINAQYVLPDGTPFTPVFSGRLHSKRIAVIVEK